MFGMSKIPLFPLGLVLLPNMAVPLHIFEERYKEMVNRCLKQEEVFGIVLLNGKKMASVGCTAKVVNVHKKYPDGKMDIIVHGQDRFEINEVFEDKSYMEGRVTVFEDAYEPDAQQVGALVEELRALYLKLLEVNDLAMKSESIENIDMQTLSFLAGFHDVMNLQEKQALLESRYLEDRLKKGIAALKKMALMVKKNKALDDLVLRNGHIPVKLQKG